MGTTTAARPAATMNATEVEKALLSLPPKERLDVIQRVLAKEDVPEGAIARQVAMSDEEWQSELERRIKDIEEGRVKLIPADDLFDRIGARLQVDHD